MSGEIRSRNLCAGSARFVEVCGYVPSLGMSNTLRCTLHHITCRNQDAKMPSLGVVIPSAIQFPSLFTLPSSSIHSTNIAPLITHPTRIYLHFLIEYPSSLFYPNSNHYATVWWLQTRLG